MRGFARPFLILWVLAFAVAATPLEIPPLSGRVVDQAKLLDSATQARIQSTLAQLEATTGAQLVVLTLPSLQGESLEDLSMRVVETWQLGRSGIDDGALLLVVRDQRKIRIEVGYGLEPVLTDLVSRRMIDHLMAPAFRAGQQAAGIESAVNAMARVIRGDPGAIPVNPIAPQQGATAPRGTQPQSSTGLILFIGIASIILIPMSALAAALKGEQAWFLYLFLAPFWGGVILPLGNSSALIGLLCWLALFPLLRAMWPKAWQVESDNDEGGGHPITSRSMSSSYSSGSSGGGFSGGGGRFGGGGASGGW